MSGTFLICAKLVNAKHLYIDIWYPPPKKSTFFMGKGGNVLEI